MASESSNSTRDASFNDDGVLESAPAPVQILPDDVVTDEDGPKLTRGGLLARNTVWNLVGQISPMAVGLFAIPKLIAALGTERFGALTIAWMVVGYFSLFDLGLGRAMTNLVAQKLATKSYAELPSIIWTTNLLMGVLGIIGAAVLVPCSPLVVTKLLKTPPALQFEVTRAFYALGCAVPFVISTAGFRGVLEARQRFDIINLIRIPMGIATFLAPLIVLFWTRKLIGIVIVLVVARALFWMIHVVFVLIDMPDLRHSFKIDASILPKLFSFGAWMTVSNVISPIMSYLDRFLIGMLLSLSAVAYYSTPFEVVSKLLIIPGALVAVLFPAFSAALVTDLVNAGRLFDRSVKYVFLSLFPPVLLCIFFARPILTTWLGKDFANGATRPLQWLAIGILVNSLAYLPFALIQGAGRPDITAKLHLMELPLYLVAVWFLTKHMGIEGTAIAWVSRVAVDAVLQFYISGHILRKSFSLRKVLPAAALLAAIFVFGFLDANTVLKAVVALVLLVAYVGLTWAVFLAAGERAMLKNYALRLRLRAAAVTQ